MSWAPHLKKISPGTAGQGCQCQLFPTAPVDSASTPSDTWHKHWSSCHPGNKRAERGERTRRSEHKLKCRKLFKHRDKNLFNHEGVGGQVLKLVAQEGCEMSMPGDAQICGMWLALSSLLQLSLLWAGDWSRWSPEVPANLSPYCASVSLGEMVGTQGLPKYKSDFCCFPIYALEIWVSYRKNWLKMVWIFFFLWIKNDCFPKYCRAQQNKIKEGRWPTWLHRELEKDGVRQNKTKGWGPGRDAWLPLTASMKRQR